MIDNNYNSFAESCLRRAGGDQRQADYLFDCSYFEYYYRCMQYNRYQEWMKDQMQNK